MATIRDIAKLAGVSPTTVSRVLNLDDQIKTTLETKKRIFEAAEQLSYQKPEQFTKQACAYALAHWYDELEELNDPFFLSIRLGIEKEFKKHNILLERYFNSKKGHSFQRVNKKFKGLIVLGKFSPESVCEFAKKAKNVILVHDISKNFEYDSVTVDFKQLTRDVLDKMIERGHTRIGFIGGNEIMVGSRQLLKDERQTTFVEYLNQLGLYNDKYVKVGRFSYNDGYLMMKSLIHDANLPTCLFAASDTLAIGALRALQDENISVPDTISVISCNDIPAAKYTTPSLSTVKIYTELMGNVSANLLLTPNDRKERLRIVVPHEIVIRDTFLY